MSEKWESESLRWIHDVRKKNYQKSKGIALRDLAASPTKDAKALAKKLRLKRVALRKTSMPAARNKTHAK
jgi:hypothetical protein